MQQSTLLKTGLLTIAIMTVAACNNFKQPAATVENGTSTGTGQVVTSTIPDNNPYGTGPITDTNNPYTPPVTSTPSTSTGTYVGNYAPVDINAVYHTVASGDTVYNITKRYNISQDQLRAWNNMADNNVRLGTRLRVKSPDYVASNTAPNLHPTASNCGDHSDNHAIYQYLNNDHSTSNKHQQHRYPQRGRYFMDAPYRGQCDYPIQQHQ